ncbi:hypothetical protein Afil01_20400 [Actinorhabdospora filicis]|uniref:Aminoglycoside phosphotransferase domain-containing protein n=1 Tax=Actinorhabdospora filicis TaxID=1785913 RepID=A0A9W6SJP2_9ACTN|nr:phosphotransferase [Actinorhabdospora filicis]GLZ77233.1 hypothetical protein Afil01_20400 [Actinorhabdospora filicis]
MLTTDPPKEALDWVASLMSAPVTGVRVLGGGMHAATHRVETGAGPVVIRRFEPGDDAALREERVLRLIDGLGGLAPRLVGADPSGSLFGEPAVVITVVPGGGNITPVDVGDWARQLARALAALHALPIPEGFPNRMDGVPAPEHPRVVERLGVLQAQPHVLCHVDFWSGNTVWEGETLSGIVDWTSAGTAPRGYDVSWTRDDIVLLHGPEIADVFLAEYEAAAGVSVEEMYYWDLWTAHRTLPHVGGWSKGYVDLGRADLTPEELVRRKTAWLAGLEAGSGVTAEV